jgi:hypothetical protein
MAEKLAFVQLFKQACIRNCLVALAIVSRTVDVELPDTLHRHNFRNSIANRTRDYSKYIWNNNF